jgi:hypothetical protein
MQDSLAKILAAVKGRRRSVIALILSAVLLFVGLYQLEIMWIQKAWEWDYFMMPFGWKVPWYVARDVWYSFVILGWILSVVVACYWLFKSFEASKVEG